MVRDLQLTPQDDYLWPSNQVALALYKQNSGQLVVQENIFNSPIVLYSWAPVVDALVQQGIVRQDGGFYYVDLAKLADLTLSGKQWSDIGSASLTGHIKVASTDPSLSNSGNMFFGLLATTLNGGDVVNSGTVDAVLPDLKTYSDLMGFQLSSSGDLFQQYYTTGMGARPLIAGYESQLIELSVQNKDVYSSSLKDSMRILYPTPTVWSSHPLIARTANGRRLLEALKDPEIQRIAWERHGFRSGLPGVTSDPAVLGIEGIPLQITSVVDMPDPATMDRIINAITGN